MSRPKPHPAPPHICGRATGDAYRIPGYSSPLDAKTEQVIGIAVYGPRNPLNIDQLRDRIRELVAEALQK